MEVEHASLSSCARFTLDTRRTFPYNSAMVILQPVSNALVKGVKSWIFSFASARTFMLPLSCASISDKFDQDAPPTHTANWNVPSSASLSMSFPISTRVAH